MDWSPTVAYCVGLITTDGCLSGDGRHIEFSSKDLELVEYIRNGFQLTNRISTKSRGGGPQRYFRIQFGSVTLYQWLCSIGLSPRKSLTLSSMEIPDQLFADFLRGHLDGDGTIIVYQDSVFPNSLRCYTRFYSGSAKHLEWLRTTITRMWAIKGYQNSDGPIFRLCYAKKASLELLRHLYYDNRLPYLSRKWQIAEGAFIRQAEVVKLANTRASEARAERLGGSTPPLRSSLLRCQALPPLCEVPGTSSRGGGRLSPAGCTSRPTV